jgi:hypothetical protein
MKPVAIVAGLALAASAALAQIEARTATPDEVQAIETGRPGAQGDVPMKSPVLLEIPLKSKSGLPAPLWMQQSKSQLWATQEASRYVFDRARVTQVMMRHKKPGKAVVAVDVSVQIKSEWFRQDLDVTLTLLGLDGKVLGRRFWDDETVGNDSGLTFGGRTKTLHLEAKVQRAEWDLWMAGVGAPTLRILAEVQGEPSDEEDD